MEKRNGENTKMTDEKTIKGLIQWALDESCKNNYEKGKEYDKREMYYKGYAKGVSDTALTCGIDVRVYHEALDIMEKLKQKETKTEGNK
jgi:hypothetical protein